MEITRKSKYGTRRTRPLKKIHICLFALSLIFFTHLNNVHAQNIKPLATDPVVTILNTTITVDHSLLITIEIPGFQPSEVFYDMTPPSRKVRLDSVKKRPHSQNGIVFTVFDFTFSFLEEGIATLPTITATYNNKHHQIKLPNITVLPDITKIPPEAYWNIISTDQVSIGNAVEIELVVQNTAAIEKFSVNFNKNALFEQIDSFDLPIENTEHFTAGIHQNKLGTFLWTPLTEGSLDLPIATIAVQSFAGKKEQIYTKMLSLDVLPSEQNEQQHNSTSITPYAFESAFSEQAVEITTINTTNTTEKAHAQTNIREIIRTIASYVHIPITVASLVAIILLVVTLLIRKKMNLLLLIIVLVLLTCSILISVELHKKFVFTTNSVLRNIPEVSATQVTSIPEGLYALVLSESSEWVYVRLPNGQEGWLESTSILLTKSKKSTGK